MNLKNTIVDLLDGVENYIFSIQKIKDYEFNFANVGLNQNGKNLKLGPSCFGLKIFYMLNFWEKLDQKDKNEWANYINSFQKDIKNLPKNSFVDDAVLDFYMSNKIKNILQDPIKRLLNFSNKYSYELSNQKFLNAINAETKQGIATLFDVGFKNNLPLENMFNTKKSRVQYLDNLNWNRPWSAGGKFASLCVYSTTQGYNYSNELFEYSSNLLDPDTGSYFVGKPNDSREIINGAMKVISGLDWLDYEIHEPKKLIDFCIANKPSAEGCDIVDYVYVLYKCFQQSKYREKEIKDLFTDIINLFFELNFNNGGFSYFKKKSQTHYYGVEVTKGLTAPDIHGTILITWALVMMYDLIDDSNTKYKIIKP